MSGPRARIRTIKPEMWLSPDFRSLTAIGQLAFIALISNADDQGRMRINPEQLATIYLNQETEAVAAGFVAMESRGMIQRYTVAGIDYVWICHFNDHQKVDRPSPSQYPEPPIRRSVGERSSKARRSVGERSTRIGSDQDRIRTGSEGKGEDQEGSPEGNPDGSLSSTRTLVPLSENQPTYEENKLIFYHAEVTGKTGTVLIEPADLKLLRDARKVYPDEDLKAAILGLDHSAFQRGENDNGKPYQGWRYLLSSKAKGWKHIDSNQIETLREFGRKPRQAIGRKGQEAQAATEHLERVADQLRAEGR